MGCMVNRQSSLAGSFSVSDQRLHACVLFTPWALAESVIFVQPRSHYHDHDLHNVTDLTFL